MNKPLSNPAPVRILSSLASCVLKSCVSISASSFLLTAVPLVAETPTGTPTQLVNPDPKGCACVQIIDTNGKVKPEQKAGQLPDMFEALATGDFEIPLHFKVDTTKEGCANTKITKIELRPRSRGNRMDGARIINISVHENITPNPGEETEFKRVVPLSGLKVKDSNTRDWEAVISLSGVSNSNTEIPLPGCTYQFQLGGSCYPCAKVSCQGQAKNGCFTYDIPVGTINGGDPVGTIRFFTPDSTNPGLGGVVAFVPSTCTVNRSAGVITSVVTPINTIEFSQTSTTFDPNSFTITHKHTVTGGTGASFRTTTIGRVQDGTTTYLRADSTFDGTTFRYQQKKDQNGNTTIWTMESGPVIGGAFSVLRKEILQITESQPGTEIHREITQELDSSSLFSTVSDVSTTWNKFAWGWETTQQSIDPAGANLVSTWTYYQPGEISGPNGSTEGVGRIHTYTSYDGWQEVHTYWLNCHQIQQPFANQPQGLTVLSQCDPATRTTTTTRIVGGNTLSKETESYDPTTNTVVDRTYNSTNGALTTTTVLMPYGQDFGGSPSVVSHSDGTLTTYAYTRFSDGGKTVVAATGAGSNGTVTKGSKMTITTNRYGTVIRSLTETVGYTNNIVTDHSAVTVVDEFGRALHTEVFPTASSAPDGAVQATATGAKWTTATTYNCCGIETETDRNDVETAFAYDGLRRRKTTSSQGVTTETVYDGLITETHRYPAGGSVGPANLISKVTRNLADTLTTTGSPDPSSTTAGTLANSTTATSYAGGITTTVTTVPGNASQTTETYSDGRAYRTTGDLSPAMTHGYAVNAIGLLTTTSYLDGTTSKETTTSQTDWAGRGVTTTKGAITQTQTYNTLGQLEKSTDADNISTLYAYNDIGERTTTALDVNANGQIDYSGTDRITVSTTAPGTYNSTAVLTTTTSVYAANGSDAATIVSTSHRTPDGLQSWSLSLGVANPAHSISTIGANGAWTETSTAPDGTSSKNTYSGGQLEKTESFTADSTPVLIASTSYLYDALNRPWKQTDSRIGTTETGYVSSTCDAVLSIKDPGNLTTTFGYDSQGHRLTTTLPDTTVTSTSYYPDGQIKATWGSQTYPIYYTYDYAGRQLTMRTKPTLDASGNLSTTNGSSLTTWNYSPTTGQLLSKLDDAGKGAIYSHTHAGRLATRAWARGVTTAYGYIAGQLTTTDYSDTTPDVTVTHNRLGQPLTITQVNQSQIQYTYGSNLALDTEIIRYDLNHDGDFLDSTDLVRTLDRSNDNLGRSSGWQLIQAGTPDILEHRADYTRDNAGRLATVADAANTFTYGYQYNQAADTDPRVGSSTGTRQDFMPYTIAGPVHTVTHTYEAGRNVLLTKANIRNSDSTDVSTIAYTVNSIGQRTQATRSGAATNITDWGYDSLGQVVTSDDNTTAAYDRAYQYDTIGNRKKMASGTLTLPTNDNYTTNALNQYTAIPSLAATPVFDDDGNATAYPLPVAPTSNSALVWDAENRLVSVTVGATATTYLYDALARRIAKIPATGSPTLYVYDAWNCIAEYTGTTLSKTRTWGLDLSGSPQGAGGVGGLLAEKQGSNVYYPLFDGNGNITEYLNSTGAVAAHFEYDPFGNTVVNTDSGNLFNYRFSTKPLDFETGLYYYAYRYYDPHTGRWPSRDPIEERGGMNLYAMISNDCVNLYDFLGCEGSKKSNWYADGKEIQRVNETHEPYKSNGIPPDSGLIGWRDFSVTVDHGRFVIADPYVTQSDGMDARENHEKRHMESMQNDANSHAIPYKQVFCMNQNKFYIGWNKDENALKIFPFDKTKDGMNWAKGIAIKFTTWDAIKEEETRETTIEIEELNRLENPPKKRLTTLNKRIVDLSAIKNTGIKNDWKRFLDKYQDVISKAKAKNLEFDWEDPSKVYIELRAMSDKVKTK